MSRAKLWDEPGYQTVGKTDLSCDPPNPNGNKSLENVFIYILYIFAGPLKLYMALLNMLNLLYKNLV